MTSLSESYNVWKEASNKDELKFYACEKFRRDYTEKEMSGKAKLFKQLAMPEVRAVLSDISSKTDRDEIRILSLGCGPGSDLLGIMRAVNSVLRSGEAGLRWKTGELQCRCKGVDAFDWNRDVFDERINGIDFCNIFDVIRYGFLHEDMDSFVLSCLQDDGPREYDFICLSFADAGRNLQLIGTALPQLLSDFGRILVLDNNISTVRRLADYGFTRTSIGYRISMYSRGWGIQLTEGVFYRPPADSAPLLYHQSMLQRLEEMLKQLNCL